MKQKHIIIISSDFYNALSLQIAAYKCNYKPVTFTGFNEAFSYLSASGDFSPAVLIHSDDSSFFISIFVMRMNALDLNYKIIAVCRDTLFRNQRIRSSNSHIITVSESEFYKKPSVVLNKNIISMSEYANRIVDHKSFFRWSHKIKKEERGIKSMKQGFSEVINEEKGSRKYLTFKLGEEFYGIEILKIQEIIGLTVVTRMPNTAEYIRGVINLRGKIIPLIDMRYRFGMETVSDTEKTCIIVVNIPHLKEIITAGLIIDEVAEVSDIDDTNTDRTETIGRTVQSPFVTAIGKVGERVIILLDADRIVGAESVIAEIA